MDTTDGLLLATAHWTAAARARESTRADRLFDDPLAGALAGETGRRALEASEKASGGENPYLPIRTHWFDGVICAESRAIEQVVLLGAGFDTRPMRLSLPISLRWFELDLPGVFEKKEPALAGLGAVPSCSRIVVAADLRGNWPDPLLAAGFRPARRTMWLAEGLLFYLDAAAVEDLLAGTRRLSSSRSVFVADVFGTALLRQRDWGSRPPFCADDPAGLFAHAGWQDVTLTQPGDDGVAATRLRSLGAATGSAAHDPTNRTWFVVARTGGAGATS